MEESKVRVVKRQYCLGLSTVSKINQYSLEKEIHKSEVIEMAVKKFMNEEGYKLLVVVSVLFASATKLYAGGLEAVDQASIIDRVGIIIRSIGGLVGVAGLGYALVMGAYKWSEDQADAIQCIKGGMICAFLGVSAWGISKWILGMLS